MAQSFISCMSVIYAVTKCVYVYVYVCALCVLCVVVAALRSRAALEVVSVCLVTLYVYATDQIDEISSSPLHK